MLKWNLATSLPRFRPPGAGDGARGDLCFNTPLDGFVRTEMPVDDDNLIWLDLEMTGLDPDADRIIEIATIVTAPDLTILAEGPVIAVSQPEHHLEAMDAWNRRHHGQSGLIERVRSSDVDTTMAESRTLEFLGEWSTTGASPMCGNSICQDRRFLARWMPALEAFFHYRNVDVSTIKELVRRWHPAALDGFRKRNAHQALEDIRESIDELAYYREHVFTI